MDNGLSQIRIRNEKKAKVKQRSQNAMRMNKEVIDESESSNAHGNFGHKCLLRRQLQVILMLVEQ